MKDVIVLEALRPLEAVREARKSNPSNIADLIRRNALKMGVGAGTLSFISAMVQADTLLTGILALAALLSLAITDTKGGEI